MFHITNSIRTVLGALSILTDLLTWRGHLTWSKFTIDLATGLLAELSQCQLESTRECISYDKRIRSTVQARYKL